MLHVLLFVSPGHLACLCFIDVLPACHWNALLEKFLLKFDQANVSPKLACAASSWPVESVASGLTLSLADRALDEAIPDMLLLPVLAADPCTAAWELAPSRRGRVPPP
eukprot:CAMPEP_0203934964 /NCGR_PEP_ID=MMETSP0359-20131031/72809_1 /ASSEMBLY_ACC=CAM_ASM_000338 /TAXON_ID=268821 /ORGANISM="Scrippsiella Hangoei, Strain SHTV-5" /LENGTH=107 /DNA_ID=CAMNT_0050864737 /DNA_START=141 /DNA_END=461 /DNA_ORIENTATION=-